MSLMEDVLGDSERQDGDNFAIGIALEDTVHDVVLRHVTMMNSHDSTNEYWNGDGFTTERRGPQRQLRRHSGVWVYRWRL